MRGPIEAPLQQQLTHELRGDLDVITLKALAKEPGERYESAAAMAEDIERYLQHRPIRARPAPLSYRMKKFARRNRSVIAVSALAAVMVLATTGYELAHRGLLPASSPPVLNSIAVLPLKNESGDPNQQYFSDGISEDLITMISQLPGLKVIGRRSSFQFRDTKEDSRTIGNKLGVARIIEGSVRRAGDTVRVSAELINTADGSTVWSERYDRPYRDLFGLQDEITQAVAGALRTRLLPAAQVAESDRPPSGSLEAYNAYLKGRYFLFNDGEANYRQAIEDYTESTRLDPRYVQAWSGLSRVWSRLGVEYLTVSRNSRRYDSLSILTGSRSVSLTYLGYSCVKFEINGLNVYVDPFFRDPVDWKKLPKGDLVLFSHGHFDHGVQSAAELYQAWHMPVHRAKKTYQLDGTKISQEDIAERTAAT